MDFLRRRELHRCCVFLFLCVLVKPAINEAVACEKKTDLCGCVFVDTDGKQKQISLSKINKDGEPFFKGPFPATSTPSWEYSLNLCTGYTLGDGCSDVTGCQEYIQSGEMYPIGKPNTQVYGPYTAGQPLTVTYTAGTRKMNVDLYCDKTDKTTVEIQGQEGTKLIYDFKVISKSLCPEPYVSPSSDGNSGSLSAGSVIVIVFFVVLVIYVVSGVLFMKFKREETGRDVIPNVAFWSSIPGLIKDGCLFFGQKVRQLCTREGSNYENVS